MKIFCDSLSWIYKTILNKMQKCCSFHLMPLRVNFIASVDTLYWVGNTHIIVSQKLKKKVGSFSSLNLITYHEYQDF